MDVIQGMRNRACRTLFKKHVLPTFSRAVPAFMMLVLHFSDHATHSHVYAHAHWLANFLWLMAF